MRARLSQAAAACMSGAEKWRGGGPAAAAAAAGLAAPTLADLSSCAERAEGPPRPEEIGESLALRSRLRLRLRSRLLLSLLLR